MQEITDYLNDAYGKTGLDAGKLWQEIMNGNIQGGVREFAAQAVRNFFLNSLPDGKSL